MLRRGPAAYVDVAGRLPEGRGRGYFEVGGPPSAREQGALAELRVHQEGKRRHDG